MPFHRGDPRADYFLPTAADPKDLSHNRSPTWVGCLVAVFGVGLAWFLQKVVWSSIPASPFLLFYPVVFLAAWVGGIRCGIIATVLSVVTIDYWFLPPYESSSFRGNWVIELIFFAMGCAITFVIGRQKNGEGRERKLKEESQAQRKMYDALLDATEDHVFMYDRDRRFIYLNRATVGTVRAALREFGKDSEQSIVGKSNRELGYPDELFRAFEDNLDKALSGQIVKDVLVHPSPVGPRAFEYVLSPVLDSRGRIVAVTGFTRDIQDRRIAEAERAQAESKLRETAERVELALRAGKIGIFEMDLRHPDIPVQWSDRQYLIFEIDPREGPIFYSDFQKKRVHPDDLKLVQREFESSVREKRDFNLTYRARMDDGRIKWIQASARASYDRDGVAYRIVGTNIDVTETVRAQEEVRESATRFRELAESMPQIVWAADSNGKAYYFNTHWFDYLGVSPNEIGSLESWNFIHPDDQAKAVARWDEALRSRKMFQVEVRMRARDGKYHWFLTRALPVFSPRGELSRWYGTLTNIDENKKAEEVAHRAVDAREEMLAIVSHDLRNPLGSILMSAAMMKRRVPADNVFVHEHVGKIQRAGRRMNDMIEDLLNLAKMEAGNFTLSKRDVCGCDVVTEALETLAPLAQEKDIRIEVAGVDEPLQMSCDHAQVLRVFSNIIGNAIKFTPEHGVVRVAVEDRGDVVLFSISDTGPGIAEQNIPHVFDRFWQAEKTRHMGTGLGLAISKGIVEAHGGRIWVTSRFGEGAKFCFTLPKTPALRANHREIA